MNEEKDNTLKALIERFGENVKMLLSFQASLTFARAKFLTRKGVSEIQFALLVQLATEYDYLTMTEISKTVGHSTAAATGLVDRLEKLGYVQRLHASDDRRKVMVQVTRKALDLINEVVVITAELLKKMNSEAE
jgi:DNA-binding MarR family transcriptional regulator